MTENSNLMSINVDFTVTDLLAMVDRLVDPVDGLDIVREINSRLESAISTLEPVRQSAE